MKYYNFFVLSKRKRKRKKLIRDKVGIKNAEIRIVK